MLLKTYLVHLVIFMNDLSLHNVLNCHYNTIIHHQGTTTHCHVALTVIISTVVIMVLLLELSSIVILPLCIMSLAAYVVKRSHVVVR